MEVVTSKIGLFPGCSLEGSAGGFQASLACVFSKLGIHCETLTDWNCCGATSAHAVDHDLYLALSARNLTQAQHQGYDDVLAPCAACFHRLAKTQQELHDDPELLKRINQQADLDYEGNIRVRNLLHFLTSDLGPDAVAAHVVRPLKDLRVACYYGCLNTRLPRCEALDDREYPMAMDRLVEALGATAVDWGYKTDCCGASLFVTKEATSAKLVGRILKDAEVRGADCIVVACPMCHNNLDAKQDSIRATHEIARPIPVVFISQLMGLALGSTESELKLHESIVPFDLLKTAGNTE